MSERINFLSLTCPHSIDDFLLCKLHALCDGDERAMVLYILVHGVSKIPRTKEKGKGKGRKGQIINEKELSLLRRCERKERSGWKDRHSIARAGWRTT